MATINEAVQRIRELLLNPKDQKPNINLVFGSLMRETQNIYNELSNSSQPWSFAEFEVALNDATDYRVGTAGRPLFVTYDNGGYPQSVEFTDLADASGDWWGYYPVVAARPEDYNFSLYGTRIAFYRKEGVLWMRIPPGFTSSALNITCATGNWSESAATTATPVLSEYAHLAHIRAAKNLIFEASWSDDMGLDERKADRQSANLSEQEARVYQQFVFAKRSLNAGGVTYIETNDGWF